MNFGSELGVGADGQFVTLQRNRPVTDAIDLQVFVARDLAFDLNAGAETSNATGKDCLPPLKKTES